MACAGQVANDNIFNKYLYKIRKTFLERFEHFTVAFYGFLVCFAMQKYGIYFIEYMDVGMK